jgi:hypothetical protein
VYFTSLISNAQYFFGGGGCRSLRVFDCNRPKGKSERQEATTQRSVMKFGNSMLRMKMKRIPVKESRNALASAFIQYHQLPKMTLLSKRVVDTAIYFKRNTTGSTRYIQ